MKHRVLFIEGLPGSGKSTYAKRLEKDMKGFGYKVLRFNEGMMHPIDLAWCARFDSQTYREVLDKYDGLMDQIKQHTEVSDNRYIVAYTQVKINHETKAFYQDMAQYEIYAANDLEIFKQAHLERWKAFSKNVDKETLYIFECVSLQNHVNELILKYNVDFDGMLRYLKDLFGTIRALRPLILYTYTSDVDRLIGKTAEVRRAIDPTLYKDWIDHVIEYISQAPNAKKNDYLGYAGVLRFFKARQETEVALLKKLNIDYHCFELDNDYEHVYQSMLSQCIERLSTKEARHE